MLRYLLSNPDAAALALLLLLLTVSLGVGLLAGWRADRRAAAAAAGEAPGEPADAALLTSWPHLLRRELIAALLTLLLISWWALALEVPLDLQADPEVTPRVTKAPWFFLGVQELLQYVDPWLGGVVLPALLLLALAALPYLDRQPQPSGSYTLARRPWVLGLTLAIGAGCLALTVVGLFFRGEAWLLQPAWRPQLPDLLPPLAQRSLADALGLGQAAGLGLGAVICLGPFLAPPLLWPRARRRDRLRELGLARFWICAALLWIALLVGLKVALVAAADVRYLWVTPWFRI